MRGFRGLGGDGRDNVVAVEEPVTRLYPNFVIFIDQQLINDDDATERRFTFISRRLEFEKELNWTLFCYREKE